jgi:hypothetical protein
MNINKKINVIYIVPSEKNITGGEKVIYRHSEILNKVLKNISSEIIPLKRNKLSKYKNSFFKILNKKNKYAGWGLDDIEIKSNHKPKFVIYNTKFRNKFAFNKNTDFVILPEIFAHLANDLLIKYEIPYAIFVQNGFALDSTNDFASLKNAYKRAKLILSVSESTTKMIKNVFGSFSKKIFKINLSVGSVKLEDRLNKKNLITYMPRKLPTHSQKLLFMLKSKLLKTWSIKALDNIVNENELYNILKKSKIFLSFSHMEGLGLPPLEAAKEGNKVIGYTGEGGKEYWKKPIFTEIPYGNLDLYLNEILKCIKNEINYAEFKKQRKRIYKKYSTEAEHRCLKKLIYKIL